MKVLRGLAALAMLAAAIAGAQQLEMAVTFDDLPVHGRLPPGETRLAVAEQILRTLQAEKLPPTYGFVNGVRVQDVPKNANVLAAWRAGGQLLGNHTWSHPDINTVTATAFERNITRDEPILRKYMGDADWRWFRYPFLHEGDTLAKHRAVRTYLKDHGYRIAEVNMDFEDYLWNDPYARCMAKGDQAGVKRLHDTYLATADEYVGVFRELSRRVYGRDVKYILLLHIGAFDARMFPELLALYRSRGFRFVSLEEAESDPAYQDDPDMGDAGGGGQLEQMMEKRKIDYPASTKPYKELERMCR